MPSPSPICTALLAAGLLASLSLSTGLRAADDVLIADFETADYGGWSATGDAFGDGPAQGTLPGQMPVSGFIGRGYASSFHHGDGGTGTLVSPAFAIVRPYITFLIGGGKDAERTCMQLIIDGRVVRTATGSNDRPGGSEALIPGSWEVRDRIGQMATIRLVDQATRGWGHITVDQIVQTDRRAAVMRDDMSRDIPITSRYLLVPIADHGPKRQVTLLVDGQVVVRNDIALADGTADWWAFMEVDAWKGRTGTIQVDRLPEDSHALSAVIASDAIADQASCYHEAGRGQFHFSSRRGWLNDPNGLSWFNGEYHLFYQHNPYGVGWGNMHWGHAVSGDLVHWRELGDVLAPDALGPMFSGSAVVDAANTSGLGTPGHPPRVLIYTAAGSPTVQCLAASTDGRTYRKFSGNPVLPEITGGNRDPKVFWHAPTKSWVMVLYVGLPHDQHTVQILTSPNLRDWTRASSVPGGSDGFLFECPDLFPLAVDGNEAATTWVLSAANGAYAIGSFDGRVFTPERTDLPSHQGGAMYAAQTFSACAPGDGRRIQIGWLRTAMAGMPFSQAMTIPMQLGLTATPDGPRLTHTPVVELEALRTGTQRIPAMILHPGDANPLAGSAGELVELRLEFAPEASSTVMVTVRGATIAYDAAHQQLTVQGERVPAPLRGGRQRLVIYGDRNALEVVASDGLAYVPVAFLPKPEDHSLALRVAGGTASIAHVEVSQLGSIWK